MSNFFMIALVFTSAFTWAQREFVSEEYSFSIEYPSNWIEAGKTGNSKFTVTDGRDTKGKVTIADVIDISVTKSEFNGDMEAMSLAYRKQLYDRPEFSKEEITSEKIVSFKGVKAIEIEGNAKIKAVGEKLMWRMYLFEYQGNYFELTFSANKKRFEMQDVQTVFFMAENSFTLI